jgi:hypothetical protein
MQAPSMRSAGAADKSSTLVYYKIYPSSSQTVNGYRRGSWSDVRDRERQALEAFLGDDYRTAWLVSPLARGDLFDRAYHRSGTFAATGDSLIVIPKLKNAQDAMALSRRFLVSAIDRMFANKNGTYFTYEDALITIKPPLGPSWYGWKDLFWILVTRWPQLCPSVVQPSQIPAAISAGTVTRATMKLGCLLSTKAEKYQGSYSGVSGAAGSAQYAVTQYALVRQSGPEKVLHEQLLCQRWGPCFG